MEEYLTCHFHWSLSITEVCSFCWSLCGFGSIVKWIFFFLMFCLIIWRWTSYCLFDNPAFGTGVLSSIINVVRIFVADDSRLLESIPLGGRWIAICIHHEYKQYYYISSLFCCFVFGFPLKDFSFVGWLSVMVVHLFQHFCHLKLLTSGLFLVIIVSASCFPWLYDYKLVLDNNRTETFLNLSVHRIRQLR